MCSPLLLLSYLSYPPTRPRLPKINRAYITRPTRNQKPTFSKASASAKVTADKSVDKSTDKLVNKPETRNQKP